MSSLKPRVKRQATRSENIIDITLLLEEGVYTTIIQKLTEIFTEPGEVHDNVKVTKRDNGFTKVVFKSGNTEVPVIYRNRDLYIIGWIVGTEIYLDKDSYKAKTKEIENALKKLVPGNSEIKNIGADFSYRELLPDDKYVNFVSLPEQMIKFTNTGKLPSFVRTQLGPFVIAFAEGIRFPVIAEAVKNSLKGEKLNLRNGVLPAGWGNGSDYIEIEELMKIWGKLSECVETLNKQNICQVPIQTVGGGAKQLGIEKGKLNEILRVANSKAVAKPAAHRRRAKRDAPIAPLQSMQLQPALLHHQANLLDYDGHRQPFTDSSAINSISFRPDVAGALHLLTLGILYLSGGKLIFHHSGTWTGHNKQREASAIATELTERIVCFIKSTRTGVDVEFDKEMEIQRQLATALARGDGIETIVADFIEENIGDHVDVADVRMAAEMLSKAVQEGKCF